MNLRKILEVIERKYMPQIQKEDLGQAIDLLQKNGIKVQLKTIDPNSLQNSQRAVNREKVQNIIKDIKGGKSLYPIIISNDGYIVDGHHRWIAFKLLKKPLKAIQIDLPKNEAIIEFKKIEGSISKK